jgi:hypothetical protein
MPRPRTTRFAGYYEELTGEELSSTDIELATRVEHDDGSVDFLIHRTTPDFPWEARLSARRGSREFTGRMWSGEWEGGYELTAELWVSPDGDDYLLLGTAWSDEEEEVVFKIELSEEDDE